MRLHPGLKVALRWVLAIAVIALVALAVRASWADLMGAASRLDWADVVVVVGLNVLANLVLAFAWRRMLGAAQVDLEPRAAVWIWSYSQVMRYIASGAQIGGRMIVARRYGVTGRAAGVSTLMEIAWQFSIASVVILATLPWWLPGASDLLWVAAVAVIPVALLVVGILRPRTLLRWMGRALEAIPLVGHRFATLDRSALDSITTRDALAVSALQALNTALRLAALLWLLRGLGGDVGSDSWALLGADSVGQLAGRVALFAPGGIGVREGATTLVVARVIGPELAVLIVVIQRACEIIGEAMTLTMARLLRPADAQR